MATFLAQGGCNILESPQYDEVDASRFFMRVVFGPVNDDVSFAGIRTALASIAAGFVMDWQLHAASVPPRVLIMVSRQDRSLNDLLYRWKVGALSMEPVAIGSNHRDSYRLAAS